jgi:hypothetical protein
MAKKLGRLAAILAGLVLAIAAPAGAATIWTPLASGTTQDITAIDYQSDAAAWFATSNGQLFYANGAGFTLGGSFPGNSFDDVAFQPGGNVGYAVTVGGHAYRSIDGGHSWSAVALPVVRTGCSSATTTSVPRLNAVVWADASTAYLVGGSASTEPVVLRTTNATTAGTFTSLNSNGATCLLSNDGDYITDGFAVPGNANALSFITEDFGAVFQSSDGFASALAHTGDMINNFSNTPRMTFDPNNPNRIWAVDHAGSICGGLCFQYSEAAGASDNAMTLVGSPADVKENLYGVGFAGGTLVAAGDAGEIYTSVDGKNAYLQPAAGAQATTSWRAVGVADATHALVGGSGGALVKSTSANAIPDTTAPTGTIGGPSSVQAGHIATYTASLADEPGGSGVDPASLAWTTPGVAGVNGSTTAHFTFTTTGFHTITLSFRDRAGNAASAAAGVFVTAAGPAGSGSGTPANASHPVVKTSGGAKITLYKTIRVGKGRNVPVRISTKVPRNFVLEILTSKRPYHHVATLKTSLRKGSKTVKIKLPRKLKNGKYLIVVRVFKGKHGLGRSIRQAFIITS